MLFGAFGLGGLISKKAQFKIYALFLLADGQWRYAEMKFLDTISAEMKLDDSTKKEILSYCRELKVTEGDCSDLVIQEIDKVTGGAFSFSGLDHDPCLQVETIWTLMNLGYADEDYSEPEKKVVLYLIRQWKVKRQLVAELTDTAKTILLLTKQKDWLKSSGLSQDEIQRRRETVDQQIQLMFDNIQATITEADAV